MKIAVLGCGNMAKAICLNIHKSSPNIRFYTYTPSFDRAFDLALLTQGEAFKDLNALPFSQMDAILIGCKPQQLPELAKSLNQNNCNLEGKVIISMLAAVSIATLKQLLKSSQIIRIMPNTPIAGGHGITLFYANIPLSSSLSQLLSTGSILYSCQSEAHLDQLMAITGSGPAYVFYFANTLYQKLISLGEDEQSARLLIGQLFSGASKLIQSSGESLSDLVGQVTSKAGVTIEAIKYFDQQKLPEITSSAIDKAIDRSEQITREIMQNFPK